MVVNAAMLRVLRLKSVRRGADKRNRLAAECLGAARQALHCTGRISARQRPQVLGATLRALHAHRRLPTGLLGGHEQLDKVPRLGLGQQRPGSLRLLDSITEFDRGVLGTRRRSLRSAPIGAGGG